MKYAKLILLSLIILSCSKQKNETLFTDTTLKQIGDLQDRRQTDSLIIYLSSPISKYREHAAIAFASVQDSVAVTTLQQLLLNDSVAEVRLAAAYALGQINATQSSVALSKAMLHEQNNTVLREVLESFGKTANLGQISILTNYQHDDTIVLEGKAWGLYRLGLRNLATADVVSSAYNLLGHANDNIKLAASHFFARTSIKDFKDIDKHLLNAAQHTQADVRIAATLGLRNLQTDSAIVQLSKNYKDKDERVRISALRALRFFSFNETSDFFFNALNDSSSQVRVAAAEAMSSVVNLEALSLLKTEANKNANWRVQSTLYQIIVGLEPNEENFSLIKNKYKETTNNYHKAVLLQALGKSASNVVFIGETILETNDPVILSAAALSLTACNSAIDFKEPDKLLLLDLYKKAIAKSDAAVTGIIAQVLGDSTKNYKTLITDLTFLKEARKKLSLPKDNESIQPLDAAIAYLEGKKSIEAKNEFNHPIDWKLIQSLSSKPFAIITTTKGIVELQLFPEEAPGSVANFVALARQGYFNNKFFHRVVPNFVIQGGCNRGDGYGSEAYSIRSEFSKRRYTTGSVGMASAGKDTEGTQWFITHSPTPHLDGRYSIFAEVTKGMNVVNAIEVGDKILKVEIL